MAAFWAWLASAGGIFGVLITAIERYLGLDPIAMLFALLTPMLLLYGRHEVRLRRLRSIKDFLLSFGTEDEKSSKIEPSKLPPQDGSQSQSATLAAADPVHGAGLTSNPSFEFVKSKYISDLQIKDPNSGKNLMK